eukprot:scaffold772_cov339-Pavlova_lutheri.AAC.25
MRDTLRVWQKSSMQVGDSPQDKAFPLRHPTWHTKSVSRASHPHNAITYWRFKTPFAILVGLGSRKM